MAQFRSFAMVRKNSYTFQYDLFEEGTVKNGTLRKEPFHDVYMIKGPEGEIQRVHYAMVSWGEKTTDDIKLENRNFYLPSIANLNSSQTSTSFLPHNRAFSQDNKSFGLQTLPQTFPLPSEQHESKTQFLSKLMDSSSSNVTAFPLQDHFENDVSNVSAVPLNSTSNFLEITTMKTDVYYTNETTVIDEFMSTASSTDASQRNSQAQLALIGYEDGDFFFTEKPNSLDSVNESVSSTAATTISPHVLNSLSENNSLIYDAVYQNLSFPQDERFSEFLNSTVEESSQMQNTIFESISQNANNTAVVEFLKPELVNSEIGTNIAKIQDSDEIKLNNKPREIEEILLVSPENDSLINLQSNELSNYSLADSLQSNNLSFMQNILENLNVAGKDSDNSTNLENEIIPVMNDTHGEHTPQESSDKETTNFNNNSTNILYSINKSMITEPAFDENHIEQRKATTISHGDQYDLSNSEDSEDFLLSMSNNSDRQNMTKYDSSYTNKEKLYYSEYQNTQMGNNAFLKLWRGKTGVKIEPFGVNGSYKMIPMYQRSEKYILQ
ncbi:uncharacterized protein TNIN_338741 [Trichonephila inaurata madagascariensis]|uniref:Uncharacterized protein n=1 Tax=Trichonephila inaurata madagascariensis TaxID=2747483 RepID=A0A8X6K3N4_9ARAC|nr:uncharacterized protein TNIN_338741 [Trichonephila inaurata madagascariensis]